MELLELTWPAVNSLSRDTPVVFPIAALEQHGKHMPVFTDSLLLGEVLRRAKLEVNERVLFAPLYWLGNSEHHLDFPGSMSASPRVYLDTLRDMAENFIHHGFKRILFINGHGGNIVPAQQATYELRQKYRSRADLLLLSATYWTLGAEPWKEIPGLHQDRMGHACEWETSMVLRLAPQLVAGDVTKVPDVPWGKAFEPAQRAWIMPDRSEPGHVGYPQYATAEKGEKLFQSFSKAVVAMLNRVVAWNGKEWDV
jgi:creatinine amidohydrolase